jgi:hypothetical protein
MAFLPDSMIIPPAVAPTVPQKREKTLGDMGAIIEAQRLYDPQMPSVPSVKPPNAAQAEAGQAGKTDMAGNWGKPSNG